MNNNETIVKRSVVIILGIIGLVFLTICVKSGYSVGEALGELIYNLKHWDKNKSYRTIRGGR